MILIVFATSTLAMQDEVGLYGYECGSTITNVTTISLVDIGNCDIERPQTKNETKEMLLIQLDSYEMAHVIKCTIKITRTITRCGWWSYAQRVLDGELTYFKEITNDECRKMFDSQYVMLGTTPLYNLQRNKTEVRSIVLAGSAGREGGCEKGDYSDQTGSWKGVYVAGMAEITVQDYYAEVKLGDNKIMLKSGTVCALKDQQCSDYDGGYAFWEAVPEDVCGLNKYSTLYEGKVQVTQEEKKSTSQIMYTIEWGERLVSLIQKGTSDLCGYKLIMTEHPELFFIESNDNISNKFNKATLPIANVNLFTYINTKFVYAEKNMGKQMSEMYYDILKSKCELEQKIMRNALAIATLSPSEFGYTLMKEEGYMGIVTGEVVHLVKCLKVEVEQRVTKGCYAELPITWRKQDYFLSPKTRIILKTGTPILCDPRLPSMFKIHPQVWFKMLPNLMIKADNPEVLQPATKPTWTYNSPITLLMGGVYSEKDTRRLNDLILFPMEKTAVLNRVAQGMSGRNVNMDGLTLRNFLDRDSIREIAREYYTGMWENFVQFGSASAGVIGIFIVFRLVKLIIDTVLHGYAIYSLYGFSLHLLGAIWNSVTQLLLHLANQADEKKEELKRESQEEREENQATAPQDITLTRQPLLYPELGRREQYHDIELGSTGTSRT